MAMLLFAVTETPPPLPLRLLPWLIDSSRVLRVVVVLLERKPLLFFLCGFVEGLRALTGGDVDVAVDMHREKTCSRVPRALADVDVDGCSAFSVFRELDLNGLVLRVPPPRDERSLTALKSQQEKIRRISVIPPIPP